MTSLADHDDTKVVVKLPYMGDDRFDDPGPALPPEGMEEPEFPHPDELKPFTPQTEPELVEDHMCVEGALPKAAGAPSYMSELMPSMDDAIELHEKGFASGIASLDYVTKNADGTTVPYDASKDMVPLPLARATDNEGAAPESATQSAQATPSPDSAAAAPGNVSTVEAILSDAERDVVNQNTLVFEFGPFRELENRMRGITDGKFSGVAEQLVTSYVRRAFHDAVLIHPNVAKPAHTKDGLEARIAALKDVTTNLSRQGVPTLRKLLDNLDDAGVEGSRQLFASLDDAVRSESELLKGQHETLAPPTLGRMLFDSLRNTASSMTDNHLVGNARQHRNGELTKALRSLYEVGSELKTNAGNADWERGQGKASVKEVKNLSKRIDGLTKGVEDQVDGLALRKGFNDVKGMLDDAGNGAANQDHKKALEAMSKYITELVKRLTEALGALFNRNAGAKRSSPTAL